MSDTNPEDETSDDAPPRVGAPRVGMTGELTVEHTGPDPEDEDDE